MTDLTAVSGASPNARDAAVNRLTIRNGSKRSHRRRQDRRERGAIDARHQSILNQFRGRRDDALRLGDVKELFKRMGNGGLPSHAPQPRRGNSTSGLDRSATSSCDLVTGRQYRSATKATLGTHDSTIPKPIACNVLIVAIRHSEYTRTSKSLFSERDLTVSP